MPEDITRARIGPALACVQQATSAIAAARQFSTPHSTPCHLLLPTEPV